MRVFKWVWQYVRKYKYLMFLGFFLASSVSLINMINPFVQGRIVDDVILGGNTDLLVTLLAIIAGTTLLRAVIRYSFQMIFEYVSQNVLFNIREKIYSSLQKMDFAFFDRNKTGDLMSRMTGDLEAVRHFVAFVMYSTFFNILSFLVGMGVLFSLNVRLTLSLLAISPVICFLTIRLSRVVKPAFAAIREQFSRLNSIVQENISGNRVVKAFAKEDYEIEKFLKENENFRQRNKNVARIWEKYLPVLDSMAGTLSVTVILIGGILVIKGDITLGELITFNGFIWTFNGPMRMAGWLINDMQRFAASAEKIMLVLNEQPRIANPDMPVVKERLTGSVEFKNVSFKYRDEEILKDINFKVKPGQTIGIVGPTGSGKSTLINLISRFYDCTEGEVLVDGINVKNYDIKSLRNGIAMAMQDIFLFSDTIEGNIALDKIVHNVM
jgi:ATP-binding cassette subfamily B multidrug efflux pump